MQVRRKHSENMNLVLCTLLDIIYKLTDSFLNFRYIIKYDVSNVFDLFLKFICVCVGIFG